MKPGWKSTEFWVTIAFVIVGSGIAFFVVTMQGASLFHHIAGSIALITAFIKAHEYTMKRLEVKLQEIYKDLNGQPNPSPTPTPTPISPAPPSEDQKLPPTISLPIPEEGCDSIELDIKYKYNIKKKRKLKP